MSPYAIEGERTNANEIPDYTKTPPPSLVDTTYQTKDGQAIVISYHGSFLDEQTAIEDLAGALEVEQVTFNAVQQKVLSLTYEQVAQALEDIETLTTRPFLSFSDKLEEMNNVQLKSTDSLLKRIYDIPPESLIYDLPCIPRVPYEFSCAKHLPQSRAPELGEHQDDVLKGKWLSHWAWTVRRKIQFIDQDTLSKSPQQDEGEESGDVLGSIVVVELSDSIDRHDVGIASAGGILASFGATVYKILSTSDPLLEKAPKTFSQFNKEKIHRSLAEIDKVLDKADVLLTDYTTEKLAEIGIDGAALERTHPGLIIAHVIGSVEDESLDAFNSVYINSGMASVMAGESAQVFPRFPRFFLEIVSGSFILSAVTSALYYKVSIGSLCVCL